MPDSAANVDFSDVEFDENVEFGRYIFSHSFFCDTIFQADADFEGAAFCGWADFYSATFSEWAIFTDAVFSRLPSGFFPSFRKGGDASFIGATFDKIAIFEGATFLMLSMFNRATFSRDVYFGGVTFKDVADFSGVTFKAWAAFPSATFSGLDFRDATFRATGEFVHTEMKGRTTFEGTNFELAPPLFFDAKLYEGTRWNARNWPLPPSADVAKQYIDSYACLKREMERLKKHEDELDFFALELRSRRVLLGPWRGWPIWLYGALSGYGRSYMRPLGALFVVAAIGAGVFWYCDAGTYGEALGLSAANTLNVFGFRRDFGLAIDTPLAWLEVVAALQTILGTILLFLFGLGIRNKFRMK
jgi:uncharacterized protein YjbI with pentapeptide repeats